MIVYYALLRVPYKLWFRQKKSSFLPFIIIISYAKTYAITSFRRNSVELKVESVKLSEF